ncbi:NusG domain II-containing protein [Chitinolyticbacter albus]|uniref:NusG domain II-containing protein n=1 Tax=Chitinolyticbacter albus TaxID=2961951 RepID=UPI00210E8738|nr:NusG domain II-containing protein [Chitinolyticbacter albus]
MMRAGDLAMVLLGVLATALAGYHVWPGQAAQRVRIYQEGQLYAELDANANQILAIAGPLGATRVEIARGRARVIADPSPRQYCVRAGWLQHAGDSAVCLPNRIAVTLEGDTPRYDSLGY